MLAQGVCRVVLRLAVLSAIAAVLAAGGAQAHVAREGAAASTFATGFAPVDGIGPFGLAWDRDTLYVASRGDLFRFGRSGGQADAGSRVNAEPIGGWVRGLAVGADGRLYAARITDPPLGDVVELDPGTGAVIRTLAAHVPCPTALAVRPLDGDLFVSQVDCGDGILQIHLPALPLPLVTPFARGLSVDGLTFGPDSTLFAAHDPAPGGGATVSRFDLLGRRTGLAAIPHVDGIAVARPGQPPFLVINRVDGTITRLDLADGSAVPLVEEGTRGDLIAVGGDGCLYATQTASILKVTNADGSCAGASFRSGPLGLGLYVTTPVRRATACVRRTTKVKLGYKRRGRRGVVRARIFFGRHLQRTIRTRKGLRGSVTLRRLPPGRFTIVIRATEKRGRARPPRRIKKAACGQKTPKKAAASKKKKAKPKKRRARPR